MDNTLVIFNEMLESLNCKPISDFTAEHEFGFTGHETLESLWSAARDWAAQEIEEKNRCAWEMRNQHLMD